MLQNVLQTLVQSLCITHCFRDYRLDLLLKELQVILVVLHHVGRAELHVVLRHSHVHLQIAEPTCRLLQETYAISGSIIQNSAR